MDHVEKLQAFENHVKALNPKFKKKTSSLKGIFDILDKQIADKKFKFLKPSELMELVFEAKSDGEDKYNRYKPAIQELCRVWNSLKNLDYDSDHKWSIDGADMNRRNELRQHSSLLDQGEHGCCGPAGALMALLEHNPDEFDALYSCIMQGERYRDVPKSEAVAMRLQKRIDDGLFTEEADNYLDARMCIGLTILLKERLNAKGDIFRECIAFSQGFENWQPGNRVGRGFKNKFSYKHGDIALTEAATSELLKLVGFKKPTRMDLISNERLVELKGSDKGFKKALSREEPLWNSLRELVKAVNASKTGALMAVTEVAFVGKKEVAPYDYVCHWVYVPVQNKPALDKDILDNVRIWTWGTIKSVQNLLDRNDQIAPRYALVFEK